jgi:hypothetical protein
MPECFVRYHTVTGDIYEAAFRPMTTGIGAGEAVASIGERAVVPDARTERYDGAGGVRPATAQEQADAHAAQQAGRDAVDLDARLLKAVVRWMAQKLGVPPAQARSEILTILRGMP